MSIFYPGGPRPIAPRMKAPTRPLAPAASPLLMALAQRPNVNWHPPMPGIPNIKIPNIKLPPLPKLPPIPGGGGGGRRLYM